MTVQQQMKFIDLLTTRGNNSTTFTGRPQGREVRKDLKLDLLDVKEHEVELRIPQGTTSFNASFYLGLLYDSIKLLGYEGFKNKYHLTFEGEAPSALLQQLAEGERQAKNELRGVTGLGRL